MSERGEGVSVRKLLGFEVFDVTLTPATVGQFEMGDKYGARGKVVRVKLTEISVAVPRFGSSEKKDIKPA